MICSACQLVPLTSWPGDTPAAPKLAYIESRKASPTTAAPPPPMGSILRAARTLEAQPILDPTAEVCHTLQALHSPQTHSARANTRHSPTAVPGEILSKPKQAVTGEILSKVLKALPLGSAARPSGWAYKHIKTNTSSSEDACAAELWVAQLVVHGNLSHLPRLLPFAKPSGGLQLTAVGEVWYRLAALCTLAASPEASHALSPLEIVVAVRGARPSRWHARSPRQRHRAGGLAERLQHLAAWTRC
jgi:hypothetical protein